MLTLIILVHEAAKPRTVPRVTRVPVAFPGRGPNIFPDLRWHGISVVGAPGRGDRR